MDPFFVKGSSKTIHLIFVTDQFTEDEGFIIKYSRYVSNCGGDLVATDQPQQINWIYDGTNSN